MLHELKQYLVNDMILTGGHFILTADGSSINSGTVDSFRHSAALYASEKKKYSNLGLGILINDIGAVCSASSCDIHEVTTRENFSFPDAYLSILESLKIKEEEVRIFWEKHIRNRAKKQLHHQIAKNNSSIVYLEKEGYVYRSPDTGVDIVLTRYNDRDPKGTPACPLIMSAYSIEHKRVGFKSSLNFYYIGEDNYMNVANHFVIEKGRFLAAHFDHKIDNIYNIYLYADQVMKNF